MDRERSFEARVSAWMKKHGVPESEAIDVVLRNRDRADATAQATPDEFDKRVAAYWAKHPNVKESEAIDAVLRNQDR